MFFFFFKQKTAYEMRMSDWSSECALPIYMLISVTNINEAGIQQSWLGRREVAWEDIQFAKFIPLVASKRLICFTTRGRPVVFQAGTKELQVAFARISLVYRRRR